MGVCRSCHPRWLLSPGLWQWLRSESLACHMTSSGAAAAGMCCWAAALFNLDISISMRASMTSGASCVSDVINGCGVWLGAPPC